MTKASKSILRNSAKISTGIESLNTIMGGGVSMRKMTQFSGAPSSGKSTVAAMIVANAQAEGIQCKWVDTEHRFPFEYAEKLGVDLDKLELADMEKTAEGVFDLCEDWSKKECLIVLDSVGGLMTKKEAERTNEEGAGFPEAPKLIPAFIRRMISNMIESGAGFIVLNHEKKDFEGNIKVLGGIAIPYHADTWVRFRQLPKKLMQGEEQVGTVMLAEIKKGANRFRNCEINFLTGEGFDRQSGLIESTIESGKIRKEGNSYYLGEEKLCVGMPKLRELFKDPAFLEKLAL